MVVATLATTPPPLQQLSGARVDLQDAIAALENGSSIKRRTYISLLQSCIDYDSIEHGRRLHAAVSAVRNPSPAVGTRLVSMYAKCGSLDEARRVFDEMSERDIFAWSAMVGGCAREHRWEEVVELFYWMMIEGVAPDKFLLPKFVQACANIRDKETYRLLHSLAVRLGFLEQTESPHVGNSILVMYAKCGDLVAARKVFEKMAVKDHVTWNSIISAYCDFGEEEEGMRLFETMRDKGIEPSLVTWNILIASYNQDGNCDRALELMKEMENSGLESDVFTWTCMISGLTQNNKMNEALDLFQQMQNSGVAPNGMTVASVVSACTSLKALSKGKELHSYAIKIGGTNNVLVGNSLIDLYAKCGRLEDAQSIFDSIMEKDVFSWNSMIGGYARAGYCGKAYELFAKMEDSGVKRNVITWNVMISGYIQNGDEDRAMELFRGMEMYGIKRNTASWNSLIAGYLENGRPNKALGIFRKMQSVSERPNSVSILSVLPACANLVSLKKVREIHSCILRRGLDSDVSVANALIDTYSKSGDLGSARQVFNLHPSKDHISWNTMIAGCVFHGSSQAAEDLFVQMKKQRLKPSHTTFANMIYAYGLTGKVNEGKKIFSAMVENYQLSPAIEHYSAMVHLLSRAGRFAEATDLIEKMPLEPNTSIWNSMFTAARIYRNVRLLKLAAENLIKLEPRNPSNRRLMSKILDISSSTKVMKSKDNKFYFCGCCLMEHKNLLYTFSSCDRPTEASEPIYMELKKFMAETKRSKSEFSNLDFEEENEEISDTHGEKLAVAFALSRASPSCKSIRMIKNVRVCTNCHNVMKLISRAYQCEILVKDPKCLHHFKEGICSCTDYW